MLAVILVLGLVFISIGFLITEKNAPTLLSGYNTLSATDQAKVNLPGLISFFRKFHQWFGVSFLAIGLFLWYFIGEEAVGIYMGVGPLVAYLYFLKASKKFYNQSNTVSYWAGILILVMAVVFVSALFMVGLRESMVSVQGETIEISGMYGETISKKDIKGIELVEQLPVITMRTNGFSVGEIRKGHFRLKNGEKVKLILNSSQSPFLLIQKMDGSRIYFSSKTTSTSTSYTVLQKELF